MYRYRSRVSVVILVFIIAAISPAFVISGGPTELTEAVIGYGILGVSILLVAFLLFSMAYEISDQFLTVRIGPIHLAKVRIESIELVERTYNPFSSPASSLKRLYIKAKGKDLIISPVREDEFIQQLKVRNPKIKVNVNDPDGWWRIWDWDI